ncbi:SCO family protein [Paenibacillus arenilitoris]|uniref:SCO family protein n=1 Tax=Paenibacillus arenilitoris TaxID=2772299 RepID=A0A927CH99_9BACL|nr:SCO family protein [Paenibacillus arenilitoris]MBD2868079.1 SCO family protein [Paenibacillus arenilitoris]
MEFVKKHSFKIAVLALCAAMGIYLIMTYAVKPKEELPVEKAAPAFEMQDIDGNPVSLASTNGKARIVYFYFANCPDVCPPTTFLLSQVQDLLEADDRLGSEAELISITFDPVRDTPEVIRDFAGRLDASFEGWRFLRGDEEETLQLARDFGVGVVKEKDGSFTHMNVITLVDQDGQIRKWINGSDEGLTADQIVGELNKLL